LLGFAHVGAKDEAAGYFRGFPSYWNIAAFYAGLAFHGLGEAGQWLNGAVLLALARADRLTGALLYPNSLRVRGSCR
jgi:phosphatidylcholine synthase